MQSRTEHHYFKLITRSVAFVAADSSDAPNNCSRLDAGSTPCDYRKKHQERLIRLSHWGFKDESAKKIAKIGIVFEDVALYSCFKLRPQHGPLNPDNSPFSGLGFFYGNRTHRSCSEVIYICTIRFRSCSLKNSTRIRCKNLPRTACIEQCMRRDEPLDLAPASASRIAPVYE